MENLIVTVKNTFLYLFCFGDTSCYTMCSRFTPSDAPRTLWDAGYQYQIHVGSVQGKCPLSLLSYLTLPLLFVSHSLFLPTFLLLGCGMVIVLLAAVLSIVTLQCFGTWILCREFVPVSNRVKAKASHPVLSLQHLILDWMMYLGSPYYSPFYLFLLPYSLLLCPSY